MPKKKNKEAEEGAIDFAAFAADFTSEGGGDAPEPAPKRAGGGKPESMVLRRPKDWADDAVLLLHEPIRRFLADLKKHGNSAALAASTPPPPYRQ